MAGVSPGLELLFLTQTYPRFPGDTSGPFIRDLALGLVRRGDRVTVLTPHAPGLAPGWNDGGVEVLTFRYAPERHEVLGYGRSLEADEKVKGGAARVAPLFIPPYTAAVSGLAASTSCMPTGSCPTAWWRRRCMGE
jgi:hypothetical protein